jgi:hypothetical protein
MRTLCEKKCLPSIYDHLTPRSNASSRAQPEFLVDVGARSDEELPLPPPLYAIVVAADIVFSLDVCLLPVQ